MADTLGPVSNVIAVADLFIKVGVQCSVYCSGLKNAPRDVRLILNEADRFTATLKGLEKLLINSSHSKKLSSLQNIIGIVEESRLQLQDLTAKLERGTKLQKITWPMRKEEVAGIIGRLEKYRAAIALDLQVDQTALLLNVHQEAILAKLKSAKGAAFDSPSHVNSSRCYPGTREGILERIQTWSTKQDGQCIFWLNGGAGTGKSTISRTVAQSFMDKGMLGASFFFKYGEADRGSMALFFPTIASQLVQMFPQIAPHVRAAIEADPTIHERSIKEQFDRLIAEPVKLASEASQLPTIVIVADALDECDNVEHVRLVIHLLSQARHSASVCLKFLVTSRPELAIRLGFADIGGNYEDLILHQVPSIIVKHDIALFLQHEFNVILQDYNKSVSSNRRLPLSWPGNEEFQQLVSMSVPLFIFAATACRFVRDRRIGGPKEQLMKILEQQTSHGLTSNLDATYLPIVNGLMAGLSATEKRHVCERFKHIVGSIVTLASPLCVPSLARLLNVPLDVIEDQLDFLHSVLYIPTDPQSPVRLLHLSFRDFLVDQEKSNLIERYPFWIDERKVHQQLATHCLELLLAEGTLKRNICGLNTPGAPRSEIDQRTIDAALPSEVQYACLYWVLHWKNSECRVEDGGLIDRFLNSHLLHWLETLGLIGHISECIRMINDLLSLVDPEKGVLTSAFLRDIRRIILSNCAIIDISPLQVYFSAIVFAPEQSIVKIKFRSELPVWLTVSPPVASKWDTCLQTLEGHRHAITSTAFSHDSKILASASYDKTIRIWDVITGICISTLKGHDSRVRSVAFSHNSKVLASASESDIRLWDAANGICTSVLIDHITGGYCIAFSHDSRMLASTSQDFTVKLWDVASGICISSLNGHSEGVCSIAFSHDSTTLVSVSRGAFIKLWDATTGGCKTTIKINSDAVGITAFSHDARILAAWQQDDSCIMLWNTADAECIATLHVHSKTVGSLCFSHDSKMLASASSQNDIKLWDIATSTCIATLKDHSRVIFSLHFSHDSKLLASAAFDNATIKLWDLEVDVNQIPLSTVNGDSIYGIKLIKGTKTLISESESESSERTIQLWDVTTVSHTATLTGGSAWPYSIAVAHNAKLLATTSISNGQIELWNIATGANIATIEGHNNSILSAEQRHDTNIDLMPSIIEIDGIRCIKVWRPSEDTYRQRADSYSVISAITFSQDSQLLASASAVDGIIKVWDIGSNACIATLTGHSSWVSQLFFLPQSDVLVSSSGDRTVKIWNIRTAICTATLEGQSDPSHKSIAFSHDYNMLASGIDDGSIKIWDICTGKCQIILPGSSQESVRGIAFSHSSALLASIASRPREGAYSYRDHPALEFWNISTGMCLATVDFTRSAAGYISFDEVGFCLSTNAGDYILNGTMISEDSGRNSLSPSVGDATISRRGIGLSEDSEWVMWDDDRLIWLPPAYRPSASAVIGTTLAIGCSLPNVVFMTISSSSLSNSETSSIP
ncbi:uncharacterized protein TrAtP1_005508 [Trichoderma atroviride]|uniref:uncharacterized protein n=1 Tax=Hypocrea atroviridis TaxID=63577 RepID=UPI003323675D|nr:hypothetical protein TrAtP1_005508 [Trichoderma atroviride]